MEKERRFFYYGKYGVEVYVTLSESDMIYDARRNFYIDRKGHVLHDIVTGRVVTKNTNDNG